MKKFSEEEINLHKALLVAALHENEISEEQFSAVMKKFKQLELDAQKERQLRAQKLTKASHKYNMLVSN